MSKRPPSLTIEIVRLPRSFTAMEKRVGTGPVGNQFEVGVERWVEENVKNLRFLFNIGVKEVNHRVFQHGKTTPQIFFGNLCVTGYRA